MYAILTSDDGPKIRRRIREQFRMSQAQFAREFGFSVRTLQEWEQGRSVPGGVSKHFLVVLQKEPEAVRRALELV